ncbi:MAG: NAD-dependent epimerase/dehydratase family protein [Pseudobdellovibrionaceae bacterium]
MSSKETLNVMVFGGSGFMGSHLCDELTRSGHQVTVYDVVKSPWLQPNQKMIVGDILEKEALVKELKQCKTDVVYHFAGIADIDECHRDSLKAIKYNVLGTATLLEACAEAGVKKFVLASSAYVSSDKGSFYRVTKQACEGLVEEYHKKFGFDYVILRYGSLYGPRSDARNSLFRLVSQALQDNQIIYKGSGEEKREFIHVLDAAKLSVQILNPKYSGQKILLTGNRTVEYKELLEMIQEMLKGKVKIEFDPQHAGTHYKLSPYTFQPDIVHKLVGDYHVDFGQGLLALIQEIHEMKSRK